jgi:hypothetical protein
MNFKVWLQQEDNLPVFQTTPTPDNPKPTQTIQTTNKVVTDFTAKPDSVKKVGTIASQPRPIAQKTALDLGSQAFKGSSPSLKTGTTPTHVGREIYNTATGGGQMKVNGGLRR